MTSIYRLTLRQLAGRWRLAIIAAVATLPPLIAVMMLHSSSAPSMLEFETAILGALLAGAVAPLVMLALAAAALGDEVEDRTLANLMLTQVPRWRIVAAKLLAAVTVAAPFIAVSAFVTAEVAFLGDTKAAAAVTVAALAGVALYAAAFLWLGLVSSYAIAIGLLYIVLWEGFLSGFVSGVRLLSIRHYAVAIMRGLDPRRFAEAEHLAPALAAGVAALVFAAFFALTVRRLRRMDVP
jgi:ABC-2 type transport system permease protein